MSRVRSASVLAGMVIGVLLTGTSSLPWPLTIVYNPSASAPVGWYRVRPAATLLPHDLVLAWLPASAAALADERRYLPSGVPILKEIGAHDGQLVCVRDGVVSIDGAVVARTLGRDDHGRPLVSWHGCRTLAAEEVFLLGRRSEASFDSRYFGPITRDAIIGRGDPVVDVVIRMLVGLFTALASSASVARPATALDSALDRWQPLIDEAAHRFAIPARWIRDVMRLESAGRASIEGQPTISSAGAMGLMQIMPATYAALRKRYGLGADPYDPHDNIFAGAAYLSELYERYGWPSLFAVYHAGPARFAAYLSTGKPLPKATLNYLAALVPERSKDVRSSLLSTAVATIFVPLSRGDRTGMPSPERSRGDRLFVRLHVANAAADEWNLDRNDAELEPVDARNR